MAFDEPPLPAGLGDVDRVDPSGDLGSPGPDALSPDAGGDFSSDGVGPDVMAGDSSTDLITDATDDAGQPDMVAGAFDVGGELRSHRFLITMNGALLGGNTEPNFPVLLDMSRMPQSHGIWNLLRDDCADLIVTDDSGARLALEVVSCARDMFRAELHFKSLSPLTAGTNERFYIYAGAGGATQPAPGQPFGAHDVWDESFVAVYHFHNGPGGVGSVRDSTSNGAHGTPMGSGTATRTAGPIGGAIAFDGSASVDLGLTPSFGDKLTIECWARSPEVPAAMPRTGPIDGDRYGFNWHHQSGDPWQSAFQADTDAWASASFGPLAADTWVHLAGRYDGGELISWVDGTIVTRTPQTGTLATTSNRWTLAAPAEATSQTWLGAVDEVRISSAARSEAWIALTATMFADNGSFWQSYGGIEAAP